MEGIEKGTYLVGVKNNDQLDFIDEMFAYCGKEYTITYIDSSGDFVLDPSSGYVFADWMVYSDNELKKKKLEGVHNAKVESR